MMWTDNPALDAEREFNRRTAATKMWERENYRGDCPYCGKAMFSEAYDWEENCRYDEEIGEYAHEYCSHVAQEEREETEEAFDKQMGNPMEAIDNLLRVTA